MSPMSDQPLTLGVLAQFHRDIIVPDIQRIVSESESRLRNEMRTFHDEILHRLTKLESEYHLLTIGLARVEGRLDSVEGRLESLEAQYRDLLASVLRLEERLSRVEKQLDAVAAAQEKEPLRAEVADLRTRVDSLQAQVRSLEKRFDQ